MKASWTSLANRGSIPRAPSAFGLPREIPRPITWFEYKARQYAFDLSGTQNVTIRGINIFGAGICTDPGTANLLLDGLNAQCVYHKYPHPSPENSHAGKKSSEVRDLSR